MAAHKKGEAMVGLDGSDWQGPLVKEERGGKAIKIFNGFTLKSVTG